MPDTFTGTRSRTGSQGDLLRVEYDDDGHFKVGITDREGDVSECSHFMSTSGQHDSVEGNAIKTHLSKQKRPGKKSFRSVKSFMSRFVGSTPERPEKQTSHEGLVKGGLTPTLRRREEDDDPGVSGSRQLTNVKNAGSRQYTQTERSISSDSTSRPLMTQPTLQVVLPKWDVTPGTVGIYNHGNTCFMNTILHCLNNTDYFADYFVNKKFKDVIHQKGFARIVGTPRGEVTECLGALLESVWAGTYSPEVSSHFKSVVSKYNSQYKGSSQHDAQEFLLWLLDRINEDIHHSQKKKAVKESKSKKEKTDPVPESSPEAVTSLISGCDVYNKFQALYQSSLTCPSCNKKSNTYESYLCLSLPVPQKTLRPVYIVVVYLDDNPKQLKIALEMNVLDTVKDLREKLAHELDVIPKRLILCQIMDEGFGNTFGDDQPLSDIHESETIYAFETFPQSHMNSPSVEMIQVLLVHVEKAADARGYRFCCPQVIQIPRDVPYRILQRDILRSMELALYEDVLPQAQKLDVLFKLRVMDSGTGDRYLPADVEWPLYTEAVDRALSTYGDEFGPQHIKFVVEWDDWIKRKIVENDEDIFDEHQSVHKVRLSQQQPSQVSLDECLKLFTKDETLGGDDAWQCPHCGQSQKGAVKKLGLWSVPDVLVIHLKRFRQSGLRRNKLNILVNFPVSGLEMSRHVQKRPEPDASSGSQLSAVYDLYAVSNHYGNMSGGHYTAFCKNPVDSRWYEFDDTHVKAVNSREVVSRAAYLLFYQRKQLTNNTVDSLHSGRHWIFQLYGPPPKQGDTEEGQSSSMETCDSALRKDVSERRGSPPQLPSSRQSVPYDSRVDEFFSQVSVEDPEDRLQVNSPSPERRAYPPPSRSSPGKGIRVNDRNTSSYSSDSREARQTRGSDAGPDSDQRRGRPGESGGERLSHGGREREETSRAASSGSSSRYQRTESVDSSRNSGSYYTCTSSEEASRDSRGSSPPSPVVENRPPDVRRANGVMNNERLVSNGPGSSSGFKLVMHSNEIHRDGDKQSMNHPETSQTSYEQTNAKIPNQNSNNPTSSISMNTQPQKVPVWSTPQQGRRSPPPPVQNGRGQWLTPQPQRKKVLDDSQVNVRSPPAMGRQFSVPARTRPGSAIVDRNAPASKSLQVEGVAITNKPPLPKAASQTSQRPATAANGNRQTSSQNSTRPAAEDKAGQAPAETTRRSQEPEHSSHRTYHPRDYESNVEDLRQRERYPSYHSHRTPTDTFRHSTEPDIKSNFNRHELMSKYATMGRVPRRPRPEETDSHYLSQPHTSFSHRHTADISHAQHERSRLLTSHHPHQSNYQYNDGYTPDLPRYQPQLYQYATRMALQEQRELNERSQASYLKESSV